MVLGIAITSPIVDDPDGGPEDYVREAATLQLLDIIVNLQCVPRSMPSYTRSPNLPSAIGWYPPRIGNDSLRFDGSLSDSPAHGNY